jgi:hypothetical protein
MGEGRYSSNIFYLGTRWRLSGPLHAPTVLPPRKQFPVYIEQEDAWATELVLTLQKSENSLAPAGNRTPDV